MKDYLCAVCNRAFGKFEDLERHVKDVHSKPVREFQTPKKVYERKVENAEAK